MLNISTQAVDTARNYYNSTDADNFYFHVWGGEDIHVGLYQHENEDIAQASRRTVQTMAKTLHNLDTNTRVLDIGAGFGGAARYLAKTFGCQVVALNLSEVENQRDREMNEQQGLQNKVTVVDASFEAIPFEADHFDVVWSQDAILHSGDREKVLQEVDRVLKPGGQFVFTDPMQADDCPAGVLEPILNRIYLSTLGSPKFYRQMAEKLGWTELSFQESTHQLVNHYSRVLQETINKQEDLKPFVSESYCERMKQGLNHWIQGGNKGYLTWGIFHFRKN